MGAKTSKQKFLSSLDLPTTFDEVQCRKVWDKYDVDGSDRLERDVGSKFIMEYAQIMGLRKEKLQKCSRRFFDSFEPAVTTTIHWSEAVKLFTNANANTAAPIPRYNESKYTSPPKPVLSPKFAEERDRQTKKIEQQNAILNQAVAERDWKAIRKLVTTKPEVLDVSEAIRAAYQLGRSDMVKFLVESDADIGDAAATMAGREHWSAVKYMLHHNADVDTTHDDMTAFHYAIRSDDTSMARFLIEQNADIELPNGKGWTPLRTASFRGSTSLVELLINNKAAVNHTFKDGTSALFWATQNSRSASSIVSLLCKSRADPNIVQTDTKTTCLLQSAYHGRQELVKILLRHGANIECRDERGFTPLLTSIYWYAHSSERIFEGYCDPGLKSRLLQTARYLISAGANLDTPDNWHAFNARKFAENDKILNYTLLRATIKRRTGIPSSTVTDIICQYMGVVDPREGRISSRHSRSDRKRRGDYKRSHDDGTSSSHSHHTRSSLNKVARDREREKEAMKRRINARQTGGRRQYTMTF